MNQIELQTRFAPSATVEGTFAGIANDYTRVDSHQTRLERGCFARSIAANRAEGRKVAMLWHHRNDAPVGVWTDITERSDGLHVEGKLSIGTTLGRDAYQLMRDGALALSVGFKPRKSRRDGAIEVFTECDLLEISLVSMPSNSGSNITQVRADSVIPSIRELERALRDAGCSQTQAKAVLARGYQGLIHREGEDRGTAELAAGLQKLLFEIRGE